MLEKTLENIGLNKKEASVYIAALQIGSNPVSKIAKQARINRVTAYDIMEKLAKRGLVTSFTRAKVKYYTAADPELVVSDFQKKVEELEGALPLLKELTGEVAKPTVTSHEGLESIKKIFTQALRTEGEILLIANVKELEMHWSTFNEDFERKRMDYEIGLRLIALDDQRGEFMKEYDDEFQRQTKLISKAHYNFSTHTLIFDGKVALINLSTNVGVVIEDKDIVATQKALFEMQWSLQGGDAPTIVVRKVGNIKKEEADPMKEESREDQSSLF